MIVVISDLHLTDRTSGETIKEGAFRVFRERLCDMAYDASWRENKKYKPIKELHLILLGDILDVIRSTKWLEDDPRPWDDDLQNTALVNELDKITNAILLNNKASLEVLRSLSGGAVTLPSATPEGKPKKVGHDRMAKERIPVKVHIYYMVGNHDWVFYVSGPGYNKIRKNIVDAMGLKNPATAPFPHNLDETPSLKKICAQHKLYVRHGDIYDPFNFEEKRDASSIGDVIVIELLNRFPEEVRSGLGNRLPKACKEGLKELDNVRPLWVIPAWIDGLLRRTCPDETVAREVKDIWNNLVDKFLKLKFIRDRDTWYLFDLVDRLQAGLKLSQTFSFHKITEFVDSLQKLFKSFGGDEYYRNALKEAVYKSRGANYIVYGHTHHPEIVPLDVSGPPGQLQGQLYLNSGTWRRVHRLAQANREEEEFLGYYVMTYLAFYQGDERGGRPYESWSGSLAGPGSQI